MHIRLQAALLSIGLAALAYWATPALADEWNKKTTFTFDQPVEVPGHVLMPGKYVFELADIQADRNVVQIFSEDKQGTDHLVTTLMAIPDYRLNTPEKPMVTFEERRATSPEAIHSWAYPGDNYGWEFIYPKSEQLIAANTTPAPKTAAASPAPEPAAAPKPAQSAVAPAPHPAPQPVTVAQNRPPASHAAPAPKAAPKPAQPAKELPKTAGDLPLDATIGSLLMALGLGLLIGRRRVHA